MDEEGRLDGERHVSIVTNTEKPREQCLHLQSRGAGASLNNSLTSRGPHQLLVIHWLVMARAMHHRVLWPTHSDSGPATVSHQAGW
jgi:hypothetical protein|eukprot:COSAG03_NODE_2804_length_2442_cov_60.166880_2_plen_86_part_00